MKKSDSGCRRFFLFGLALFTITSFNACRNSQNETGGSQLDACALLTREEVSQILHHEFTDPNHKIQRDDSGRVVLSSCTFVPADETSFASLNLLVLRRTGTTDPPRAIEAHLRSLRQALGDEDFSLEKVEVGEAAGYVPSMGQMVVFDKERLFVLTLHRRSGKDTKTILTQLARASLSG